MAKISSKNVDPDSLMNAEEKENFEKSMKELKEGKTKSLAELKKELDI